MVADKSAFYKRLKIAGMISYIPLVLAAMPLSGYYLAEFLKDTFAFPEYWKMILGGLGLLAGIRETYRIIRLVVKIEGSGR
jgi:hypothetical protein